MKTALLLILVFVFVSCNKEDNTKLENAKDTKSNQSESTEKAGEVKKTETPDSLTKMYGFYTGDFIAVKYDENSDLTYNNKITVSLDSIEGDMLFGHSVVAGNNRPFKGRIDYKNNSYIVKAAEPGDDKYDGEFTFTVYPDSQKIAGVWNSFKSDLLVTMREYDLKKKSFTYNKNYNIPSDKDWNVLYEKHPKFPDKIEQISGEISNINASNTLLKNSDIENLYKGDLEVIRNSIYARHGYSFKSRKMRYFFDNNIDWYMPVSTDVRNELTETEKKNIELIKRFEEHAENYYDEYGR
ncbi:MAG: YARHG domain-containing protein [Ignavibacteria bacterium]|nr:YARHG domain-containing protein [Ignavibacteria bacterium]